jgi:hypothetical protein
MMIHILTKHSNIFEPIYFQHVIFEFEKFSYCLMFFIYFHEINREITNVRVFTRLV